MRQTAMLLGYEPVVPPKKNRSMPWDYDKQLYKRRNEVERFFRRIKRFRRVFTRFDKLDVVFLLMNIWPVSLWQVFQVRF